MRSMEMQAVVFHLPVVIVPLVCVLGNVMIFVRLTDPSRRRSE